MAVTDQGELAKLVDGASTGTDRHPAPQRPPPDNGDDLRVNQFGCVHCGDRAQHLRDAACALGAKEEVNRRGGVEHHDHRSVATPLADERIRSRLGHLVHRATGQAVEHLGHRRAPSDLDNFGANQLRQGATLLRSADRQALVDVVGDVTNLDPSRHGRIVDTQSGCMASRR